MRARAVRRREDISSLPNIDIPELATWQQVPNRSCRARPKADSSATRMPVLRGRRRGHISNSPHRRLHLRSPRLTASASAHRLHAACAVTLAASASWPRRRVAVWGKTAPACARLLVMGALHTYYRRAVRGSAPRPSATRSLRASLSHLVFPPLRCSPFTTLRATDRATSTSAGKFSRLCAPSGHM